MIVRVAVRDLRSVTTIPAANNDAPKGGVVI